MILRKGKFTVNVNAPVLRHRREVIANQLFAQAEDACKSKSKKGAQMLEQVLEHYPEHEPAISMLIDQYVNEGNITKALKYCKMYVDLWPQSPYGHFRLGFALQLKSEMSGSYRARESAITSYQKALSLKPYYPDAHHNLAECLLDEGKTLRHYRLFMKYADPDDPRRKKAGSEMKRLLDHLQLDRDLR